LVSVREDIESDESVVIQEWRPDSGGAAADVDDRKSYQQSGEQQQRASKPDEQRVFEKFGRQRAHP
jgi:hypothetical protein